MNDERTESREATSLVELRNVSHQFDNRSVLDRINWTIDKGEGWSLIGPNGAGKTTLVEIVTGWRWPNEGGTVLRHGKSNVNLPEWRRAVGWLSTDLHTRIPSRQSVLDTILAGVHGQTRLVERRDLQLDERDRRRGEQLLNEMGLSHRSESSFDSLSQGETQLVLVARSLISNPKLLILDEPCAGVDPGEREHFLSILNDSLRDRDKLSTVYITHHIEEIIPALSHTLAIKQGTIVEKGTSSDIINPSTLSELYRIEMEIIEKNGRYWPVGSERSSDEPASGSPGSPS